MTSSRIIQMTLITALLLTACLPQVLAWQNGFEQVGNIETLALASTETATLNVPVSTLPTSTPPLPGNPVNAEGTPFNPFELTPVLTIPVVNAEGTPLTPTPSEEEQTNFTGTPRSMPTLTPLPVAQEVNLAIGLPDDEVWLIVIKRPDNYLVKYRIPAAEVLPLNTEADLLQYFAYRATLFQLQPDERIIFESLANAPVKGIPELPPASPHPSPTPGGQPTHTPRPPFLLPIAKTVDLAEGLPDGEVWRIVVLRVDGLWDDYRVPLEEVRPYLERSDYEGYFAFRDTLFQLKRRESILFENIANASGRGGPPQGQPEQPTPPQETATPSPTHIVAPSSQESATYELHLPQIND